MTLSSSHNAGVSALSVNATRLAAISDNIANSATFGYKRANADFHSLVMSDGDSQYSAGGVRASTYRLIDQQGSLVSSENPTDVAIGGRGFLPVTDAAAIDAVGGMPLMLSTTGSFRPNDEGYLVNPTGQALMGWPALADGSIPDFPRESAEALEPIHVNLNQYASDPTTRINLGVNLPATDTEAGSDGESYSLSLEYFDNLSTPDTLSISFTPTVPASGQSNQWTMLIADSGTGGTIGEYVVDFSDTPVAGGTIDSVTTVSGGDYDTESGAVTVNTAGGPIDIFLGSPGTGDNLTQLSDEFAPVSITKDGSQVGNLTLVEFDENGFLNAIYDSGFSRTIYQVPLIDVPNPNGLRSLSNQTYQTTTESGPLYLWNAGEGPVGSLIGYAREESTVDVAGELTQMIQTQRAYSSSAKVIQTVDEMLQETTNIKR
jgi:flagellar hook protein FlgE